MKKYIALLAAAVMIFTSAANTYAYVVNPFYAIDSSMEYDKINGIFQDQNNSIYFQWGRLARNNEGKIRFTNKMSFGLSSYDTRTEYGIPYGLIEGYEPDYIVQPGDTLSSIAAKYEMTYKMLGEYNGITDLSKIQVGQKIKMPLKRVDTSSKDDFKKRYPDGKAFLSIYFEAVEYQDKKNSAIEFLNMDESSWTEFIIKPMMDTVNSFEFDGIVLDFEGFRDSYTGGYYSSTQNGGLKEKYNKFLACLKKSMGSKLLTVVVHPTNVAGFYDGYDMKGIGGIADYLILMAYDFQSFQKYTNANNVPAELVGKISDISLSLYSQPYVQPYDKVDGAVKEMLNSGVTPEKVILGVNLVGMKWIKYSKTVNGKNYFYYELGRPGLDTVESVSAEEQYIEKQAVSRKVITADKLSQTEKQELQKNGDRVVSVEYHYESPKSLYLKYYNIVKSYKLSGITVWRIGKGSEPVWRSIMDMFVLDNFSLDNGTKNSPTPTPTSKASPTPVSSPSQAAGIKITLKIGDPYMQINGVKSEIDPGRGTVPIIKDNRTLIPIRAVIESLGGKVEWDPERNLVTVTCNDKEIKLAIGSKRIIVNGESMDNDAAPLVINGRTFLPLRFLLENLGFKVEWDPAVKLVEIEA